MVDPAFTWTRDRRPATPWERTIIYEAHVKGLTRRHPQVPEALRGTYAGLARHEIIDHLKDLGVTAVELLPIHAFVDDGYLLDKGLTNYWGYNTIGFFAPEPRYFATGESAEFKQMVAHLHDAGLEVILDVVYNHTAEGNERGPTLSFKGIDNASYYRLLREQPRRYVNDTGTGNTVNLSHPRVLQMVTDSLRYWVTEMHVDGFRFDLATILGREPYGFDEGGGFLDSCRQDPVLNSVKLIAEPWDLGPGGYQVGAFPPGWAEWNDRFRDTVRSYWRGDDGKAGELASRLTGSADLFNERGRKPWASVNFVTAHDGFTLHDLVSYNDKHNEANGEGNRDGSTHSLSFNHGVEGPTDDPAIRAVRERQKRNMLATVILSRGTPMLLAGDEFGHTQRGNNNAYCQDNEISWLEWPEIGDDGRALAAFVRKLTFLRHAFPILRRGRFLTAQWNEELAVRDVTWINADGSEMSEAQWQRPAHALLRHAARRPRPGDRDQAAGRRRQPAPGHELLSRRGRVQAAGAGRRLALALHARHQPAGALGHARLRRGPGLRRDRALAAALRRPHGGRAGPRGPAHRARADRARGARLAGSATRGRGGGRRGGRPSRRGRRRR